MQEQTKTRIRTKDAWRRDHADEQRRMEEIARQGQRVHGTRCPHCADALLAPRDVCQECATWELGNVPAPIVPDWHDPSTRQINYI